MSSKKPTFACLAKASLYQIPYSNFTILFFNIFYYPILFFLFFSQLPKYQPFSFFSSLFLSSRCICPLFFFSFLFFPHHPRTPPPFFFSFFFSHHPRTPLPFLFLFPFLLLLHRSSPFFLSFFTSPAQRPLSFFFRFLLLLHKSSPLFFLSFFTSPAHRPLSFFFCFLLLLHKSSVKNGYWSLKKFGKIEAKYLKNGYWSCWSSFPCEHRYFWRELHLQKRGRQLARERRKPFLFPRMMNSNSLSWASYCSSASDFLPIKESSVACFAELLLKFCCFQPNIKADRNALRQPPNFALQNLIPFLCIKFIAQESTECFCR